MSVYEKFYGLRSRPFQLAPDPQFYFESLTHRKALSYLGYGLAQGEGFIVITGEVGAGKSILVGHLMQTIDKGRLTAAQIVTSRLDGIDMIRMAADSFGIERRGDDKASLLKGIEAFLHAEAQAGRRCLLIVDEAQNLSIDALEELRMLSNFQLGSMPLLQIFLLGQPEFRDLVQNSPDLEQLRQRIIATHHLDAMGQDEVAPYVLHRLKLSGWNGRPRIRDDAWPVIFSESEGVPRRLNMLMNRTFQMAAVDKMEEIDGDFVAMVIADMTGGTTRYEVSEPAPVTSIPQAAEAEVAVSSAPEEPAATVDPAYQMLAGRIEALEKFMGEQDEILRRVLAMMIDFMNRDQNAEKKPDKTSRAA